MSLYNSSLALRPSRSGPQARGQLSFACSVSLLLLMAKHLPLLSPPLSELLVRPPVSDPRPLLEGYLSLGCSSVMPKPQRRCKAQNKREGAGGCAGGAQGMSCGLEAGKGRVWCGGTMRSL